MLAAWLIVSIFLFAWGFGNLLLEWKVSSWPQTHAQVVNYEWAHDTGRGRGVSGRYGIHLDYEFNVDGARVRSTGIAPTKLVFSRKSEARQWLLDKIDSQDRILVYYKPTNPAVAYIALNPWPNLLPIGIGFSFLGIGILSLFIRIGVHRERRNRLPI
jgi:hypothetical protein